MDSAIRRYVKYKLLKADVKARLLRLGDQHDPRTGSSRPEFERYVRDTSAAALIDSYFHRYREVALSLGLQHTDADLMFLALPGAPQSLLDAPLSDFLALQLYLGWPEEEGAHRVALPSGICALART